MSVIYLIELALAGYSIISWLWTEGIQACRLQLGKTRKVSQASPGTISDLK